MKRSGLFKLSKIRKTRLISATFVASVSNRREYEKSDNFFVLKK